MGESVFCSDIHRLFWNHLDAWGFRYININFIIGDFNYNETGEFVGRIKIDTAKRLNINRTNCRYAYRGIVEYSNFYNPEIEMRLIEITDENVFNKL